jgi:cobalt-zinc-cadmium efflux system outer membrane protein
MAVARTPEIHALRQQALAAGLRVDAEGLFPNPEVEGMLSQKEMEVGDAEIAEIVLRQPLPQRGVRAAERALAHAQAEEAAALVEFRAAALHAEVVRLWVESETAGRRREIWALQARQMENALQALDARLASGVEGFVRKITLESALSAMELRIEEEARMAEDAAQELRARLAMAADAPLPKTIPLPEKAPSLQMSPGFRLASAQADLARADIRLAQVSSAPMSSVALRLEREDAPEGSFDTVGVAFMTELPFRSARKSDAMERVSEAELRRAEAEIEQLRFEIENQVSRVQRAEAFAHKARRSAVETRARLEREMQVLLQRSGLNDPQGDSAVGRVVELLERMGELEIRAVQAEADARAAAAGLWRFFHLPPQTQTLDSL